MAPQGAGRKEPFIQETIPTSSTRRSGQGPSRLLGIGYWLTAGIFCLWLAFTAYAELAIPKVAEMFVHLGYTSPVFRIELSVAKVLGVLVLLLPVPARLKEWAYAGFAINLGCALVAHLAVGAPPAEYLWSAIALLILGLNYGFHLKRTKLA